MSSTEYISDSLASAISNGDIKTVKRLVGSYGLSYSPKWYHGYTQLCQAIFNKQTEITKLLLSLGANINNENLKKYNTPLHLAIITGDIDVVDMLIEKHANIEQKNELGRTPLHMAVLTKRIGIIHLLLHLKLDINARSNDGATPLLIAARLGLLEIVELLLNHGADVNVADTSTAFKSRLTPLHHAVENSSEEMTTLLLKNNANVNATTNTGETPLHRAILNKHIRIVKLLVNHGADVDIGFAPSLEEKESFTPLHLAAFQGLEEITLLLLKHGANVNLYNKWFAGGTALHIAVTYRYINIVKLLLKHGVHVDSAYKPLGGFTPLHLAAKDGNEEICVLLLKCGANINAKGCEGETPLILAAWSGRIETVKILLKYGADVNSACTIPLSEGYTALHFAPSSDKIEIVKLLILYGANVNLKAKDGSTPQDIVVSKKCTRIKNLLEYDAELRQMKVGKIGNSNVTFYDILKNDGNVLAMYAMNESIVKVLKSGDYKNFFPLYGSMIHDNFIKGAERLELVLQVGKLLYSFHNIFKELPQNCTENILNYLHNQDLRNFIEACQKVL